MTGWRLGWMVAPEAAVPELEKLAQNLFISMSTFGQYGALAAFDPATRQVLDERREAFAQRRDALLPELRRLGVRIAGTPAGALYLEAVLGDLYLEHPEEGSQQFALQLLELHGVAITPGVAFGHHRAREHEIGRASCREGAGRAR